MAYLLQSLRVVFLGIAMLAAIFVGLPAERQASVPTQVAEPSDTNYVGSEACRGCHRAIYDVFSQTDMGRSMSVVSAKFLETVPAPVHIFDPALNRHFEISVEDGHLFEHDYETGSDGKEIFRDTQKVEWIIGAGANGYSAIVRRGDTLFEAPLSFYTKTGRWALSPGYDSYDFGFSRPILPQCVACHSGRPQAIPDGNGRFRAPPFVELAVGCENCHGPGNTHASLMRERRGQKLASLSIVNPANLPSWLADNICMSCHQTGDARVLQPGKKFSDFRPGTALNDTLAIFMVPPRRDAPPRSDLLQHYFSMTLSKCYRASAHKLSCIVCHDPHFQPDNEQAPSYFRSRCLSCHTERSCAVPRALRQHKNPPDDCAGCHMPKRELKEISHSALTNHQIVRESSQLYPEAAFKMTTPSLPDLVHLDAVHRQKGAALPQITLLRAYGEVMLSHPEYRERYLALAEQLRTSAPDDVSLLEALAYGALAKQDGGVGEAIDQLTRAIKLGSTLPADFEQCGSLLIRAGRFAEAADILLQGIETIPHDGELYRLLALCYLAERRLAEASDLLVRASRLFPGNAGIRALLVESQKGLSRN